MSGATAIQPDLDLDTLNGELANKSADDIVQWAGDTFGSGLILTSSFGAQAAVMLHLVTRVIPDVPVVFIDTGYLFPETYRFAEDLRKRLNLNLRIFTPQTTAARLEALHGRIWESEDPQLYEQYARITKVEPMQRALRELNARAWLAGLRGQQTDHRASLRTVEVQDGIYKVHPILAWTGKQVHEYLKQHKLPYHPLVEKGYLSIGDVHSTLPVSAAQNERAGRFSGLRQECGLHLPTSKEEDASRESSGL